LEQGHDELAVLNLTDVECVDIGVAAPIRHQVFELLLLEIEDRLQTQLRERPSAPFVRVPDGLGESPRAITHPLVDDRRVDAVGHPNSLGQTRARTQGATRTIG